MKSLECREVDELLGAYVLTALSDQERSAVDRHLASCEQHQRAIQELAGPASLLGLAVHAQNPRPELRTRIFDVIRESDATTVTLGWRSERVPLGSHVCAFHSDDEGLRQTMTFLRDGLDEPADFGVLFADRRRFETLVGWLQQGYDGSVDSLIDRGKLALIDGAPRVEHIVERIGQRFDQAVRSGYRTIRLLGFIGWNQPGWPDLDALVEFERKVNDVVRAHPAVVVCTYDVPRLPGRSLIEGGLQMHPITILGDMLVRQNPFCMAA